MKRKLLLFLSVMLVALMPLCASAKVVRLVKSSIPESWGENPTIYIHHWKGSDNCSWGSCPKMEEKGDYLTFDIGDHDSFLLKNEQGNPTNGHQTGNIEGISGDVTVKFTAENTIVQVDVDATIYRVYFKNTNNWANVYAYVYDGSLGEANGNWNTTKSKPLPTTTYNNETYYYYEVSYQGEVKNSKIIFHNGSDQTGNLDFIDKAIYSCANTGDNTTPIGYVEDQPVVVEKDPIYIIGQVAESEGIFNPSKCHELKNIKGTNKYYSSNLVVINPKEGETTGGIGITTKLGSNADDWSSINGYRYKFTSSGDSYVLEEDSYNTNPIAEGTYYIIVDMDTKTAEIGDAASHLKSINQPEALYMYGNFWDRHFDFSNPVVALGVPSTEGDNMTYMTYKFENILIVGASEEGESGYFILGAGEAPATNISLYATASPERVAPENVDWTGIESTHRYVLGENNVVTPLVANAHPTTAAHCTEIKAGNYVDLNVTLAADGNHTYEINTHDVSTGVEAIEAEANAPVEYYNLQGVRVANPENGIFIRRQGNKVSKVAIR